MLEILIQQNLEEEQSLWLQNRWKQLCDASNIPSEDSTDIYRRIEKKYNKKSRAYHNFSHLYSFLKTFDTIQTSFDSQNQVFEWSIWMHDYIYNPLKKNNELKSAKKMRKLLGKHLSEKEITEIYELILSTAHHQLYYQEEQHRLFLDIDLAVLATDNKTYSQYTEAIRREYKMYPNFLYKKGRRGVLRHFLEREFIYFTEHFRAQYESIARKNLKWELEMMTL